MEVCPNLEVWCFRNEKLNGFPRLFSLPLYFVKHFRTMEAVQEKY